MILNIIEFKKKLNTRRTVFYIDKNVEQFFNKLIPLVRYRTNNCAFFI